MTNALLASSNQINYKTWKWLTHLGHQEPGWGQRMNQWWWDSQSRGMATRDQHRHWSEITRYQTFIFRNETKNWNFKVVCNLLIVICAITSRYVSERDRDLICFDWMLISFPCTSSLNFLHGHIKSNIEKGFVIRTDIFVISKICSYNIYLYICKQWIMESWLANNK